MNNEGQSKVLGFTPIAVFLLGIILIAFVLAQLTPVITINQPLQTIDFHALGNNLSVQFNIGVDFGQTCLFEYNGVNTTLNCPGENFSMIQHANQSLNENLTAQNGSFGVVFNNSDIEFFLIGFNKSEFDESTRGQIRNQSEFNISECNFNVNNYCEFDSAIILEANRTYYLVADGNGTQINRFRFNAGPGIHYPMRRLGLFDWASDYAQGLFGTGDMYTIQFVNLSNLNDSDIFTNSINISSPEHNQTFSVFANSTTGEIAFSTRNWTYLILQNEFSTNATEIETDTVIYTINITYNSTQFTTISANFIFNGTVQSSTRSSIGDNAVFTSTIQIPIQTVESLNNLQWGFFLTNVTGTFNVNSTISNQTIQTIDMSIFGANPFDNPFINFTFTNETINLESTNATIDSTFTFWLGDGTINKTFNFINGTENSGYSFSFSAVDRTVNVAAIIKYNNAESQQRTFTLQNSALTNATFIQQLFLIPTSLGIFTRYKTVNINGEAISGVLGTVNRVISGTSTLITTANTDSSGLVSFFLNPDATYDYVFSKTGFADNIFSLNPNAVDTYTITMGSEAQAIGNGTTIILNTTYEITPTNNTLRNNTDVLFGFNVTSTQPITFISMNITNSTGSQLLFVSNSGTGFISGTLNTGNNTKLIGRFFVQTSEESFSVSKVWIIGDEFVGDYSITRQFRLFLDYEFSDFIRILLVIGAIIGVLIFLSGTETIETKESQIIIALLMIYAFSFVGWLDTGLVTNSTTSNVNKLAQFSSQYGIAIITTAVGAFFLLGRAFRR